MKLTLVFLTCTSLLARISHALDTTPNITTLSTLNVDFGMNLYRRIASYHDENIFFSPLCIFTAFAALSMGARGPTQEQILHALQLTSLEKAGGVELLAELYRELRENITQNGVLQLDQATSLFIRLQFDVEKAFIDQMKEFFDADTEHVDFSNSRSSKAIINEYIRRKTANKITEAVTNVDPLTQLILINTIFFQGKWEAPFDSKLTANERFYVDKYRIIQVPMMLKEDEFYMVRDIPRHLSILKLPYLGGSAMLILLPDKGEDYTAVDDYITAKNFLGWIKGLRKTKVELNLPRFKMEQSYTIHTILPDLGIVDIFTDSANLTGLSTEKGLKVSEVVHKAMIEVDEKGTIAGAVTKTGITPYSLPHRFVVDRPFFFFIYHEATNTLLFMGRVIDPTLL